MEAKDQPIGKNRPALGTQAKSITLAINEVAHLPEQRTIVVLGVERGGTSMVAGVLRGMGINLGDRAGLNHEDPKFISDDPSKLRTYIRSRNERHDIWGFKMPKATMALRFLEPELRNPIFIVAYRNPLSIADSWMQRGAGQLVDVLERVDVYQNELNALYRRTNSPTLLVNYERALLEEETRECFVDELANFVGWELGTTQRARSIGMMTGDGGGYVNLPEHYFYVTEAQDSRTSAPLEVIEQAPDPRNRDGWVEHPNKNPRVVFKMKDGSNFPKRFRMSLKLTARENTHVLDGNLRICFRYTDKFIAAHCARPALRQGENTLDIETSGLADAVAFMPLMLPCAFKCETRFTELPTDEGSKETLFSPATPHHQRSQNSLWSRLINRSQQSR